MVLGEAHRPPAAGQQQAGKGAGIQRALPPIDAAHFLLVQAGQRRFREYDFAQQMMNEACTPSAKAGKGFAGNTELTTDFNGSGVQFLLKLRSAGEVETAQLAGSLIAIAAERQFVKQAKFVANLAQLPRKVEDATAPQRVALLVHAQDHLAVQAPEQFFEFLTNYLQVCAVLILAEAGTQHLVAFLARHMIEELIEPDDLVGLAEYQIDRGIDPQALVDFMQALPSLASQDLQSLLPAVQEKIKGNIDQHAVERLWPALTQQIQQGMPRAAVDLGILLRQVTASGIDQHGVLGEIPVGVAGARDILGQAE